MRKPDEHIRTTLAAAFDGETELPYSGVYILAYMGKIVYVGRSVDLPDRLRCHCARGNQLIDAWLYGMRFDYQNIRLDILASVDPVWLKEVEDVCIKHFKPLLNV
jgi:hypothetical protein